MLGSGLACDVSEVKQAAMLASHPFDLELTSFLLSLSLWISQRIDAWGDLGKHSRKVVLFFTPYCVISTAFL